MKEVYIYVLIDPENLQIRYVGKTAYPEKRYYSHIHVKKKSHCSNWIESLKERSLIPHFIIIDTVPENNWQYWETYYIAQYKESGYDLTNHTLGGDGINGKIVDTETRLKISNSQKGNKGYWFGKTFTDEHKKKIGDRRKGENHPFYGKNFTLKHRQKLSESFKGRILTQEHKDKISANNKKGTSRKVINIITKVIYNSITEACKMNNISISTLLPHLKGYKKKNKTNLIYYDEYNCG